MYQNYKIAGHVARLQTIPLADEPFSCVKITLGHDHLREDAHYHQLKLETVQIRTP